MSEVFKDVPTALEVSFENKFGDKDEIWAGEAMDWARDLCVQLQAEQQAALTAAETEVERKNKVYIEQSDQHFEIVTDLQNNLSDATTLLKTMKVALEDIPWQMGPHLEHCPSCTNDTDKGHKKNCTYEAALAAYKDWGGE